MRKSLVIMSILLFGTACKEDIMSINNFLDDASIQSIKGSWKVVSYDDLNQGVSLKKNKDNSWGFDVVPLGNVYC